MDLTTLSIRLDPDTNRKVINEEFRIIKKIGQGQFGKVLQGEVIKHNNCDEKYVAIKTINRIDKTRLFTKAYLSQTTKIKREIQIMKECNHPNVVKLYQVIDDLKFDKILLILEYCKFGEIDWKRYNHYYEKYQSHSNNRKPLTINKILRDVVNGLEYLHNYKKIIHRDLKPSNLLINNDNTIKISDFGVSLILENNANDEKELGKTMGTPAFFAPELCQFVSNRYSMITNVNHSANKIKIDSRIDIWSLGITLYCLMFNDLPFSGCNEYELFQNIVKEELKFPRIIKNSKTTPQDIEELKYLKNLIKKLLIKDPNQRININDIKHHPFTTFDLSDLEKRKFFNFNEAIFKDATKKKQLAYNNNNNNNENHESILSTKIKQFFGTKKPETISTIAPISPIVENVPIESFKNLEPVDDLLDSYLDDSTASYGSDVENVDQDIDTSNILKSLNDSESFIKRLDNLELSKTSSSSKQKVKVIPLDLKKSSHINKTPENSVSNIGKWSFSNSAQSPKRSNHPPEPSPVTPTNNSFMTIGASSPSSIKSIFSPSRRFFSRNKKDKEESKECKPTINSLSSPAEKRNSDSSNKSKYTDLMEPPPIFGLNSSSTTSRNSTSSTGSRSSNHNNDHILSPSAQFTSTFDSNKGGDTSRKNSISSSQFGYKLTRITSSSSSLNLNAYLTDDSYTEVSFKNHNSINSQKKKLINTKLSHSSDVSSDGEDTNNDTFILENPNAQVTTHDKYEGLNDYLDRLQ
ncbi:kinase-like domain-containing protein [Scheffersomyces amazonensis]|uniref:kinase-like domain-containing protein n=1 Tax=Scheffersomyces amazonensis TaxID=1078765 RepID=UPI00315D27B0